jgi:hypothetical protein
MPASTRHCAALFSILVMVICAPAVTPAVAEPVARGDSLEVEQVAFDPITPGKNTFTLTIRNLTDQPQGLAVHVQTRSGESGAGWGTAFTDQLAAAQETTLRYGYTFMATPEPTGWVQIRLYNPPTMAQFEDGRSFCTVTHTAAEIGFRSAEAEATSPGTAEGAEAVGEQFVRFQQAVRDKKYPEAWPLLSRTLRQAAFLDRLDGPYSFTSIMNMEPSPASWGRTDVLRLEPVTVRMRGPVALLSTRYDEAGTIWTVEFIQENGEWRVDRIDGRPPLPAGRAERLARLLPRLEHRATAHFDIYYAAGSSAARDIDRIAAQREAGYQAVSEALGLTTGPRILLIFFEDADTKTLWARHQGNGLAEGTTIVELYNDTVKVDPYHEVTHILAATVGGPPAILDEGLATYMAARLDSSEASLYEQARQLKHEGKWIPLPTLLTFTEIGSEESQPEVAYPEAGAFVKFVVDTYGKEKLLAAYRELRKSDDKREQQQNAAALERIYSRSVADLNRDWLAAMGIEEAGT